MCKQQQQKKLGVRVIRDGLRNVKFTGKNPKRKRAGQRERRKWGATLFHTLVGLGEFGEETETPNGYYQLFVAKHTRQAHPSISFLYKISSQILGTHVVMIMSSFGSNLERY